MKLYFSKYQGTGNDFILIDDREARFPVTNTELIAHLCHRRFGIGADGLMLLRNRTGFDFEMVYFNSDGRPSTMCGNGGRCIAAFARNLGIGGQELTFLAADGPHRARFAHDHVFLTMKSVEGISPRATAWVLDTGSPHFVLFQDDIESINFVKLAKGIRYNAEFEERGINVNFVKVIGEDRLQVRTYERGVEDETYSCGTGVVASALAYIHAHKNPESVLHTQQAISVNTLGGDLQVRVVPVEDGRFEDVWLIGPAKEVFIGEIREW